MALTVLDTEGIFGSLGLGSDHIGADERPTSFRETVLRYGLNGQTSLTALTARSGNEKTPDIKFSWWEEETALQNGAAAFYINDALSAQTGYDSIVAAGSYTFAKVTEAVAKHFRENFNVQLIDLDGDVSLTITGRVEQVVLNGASSFLKIKLTEAAAANFLTSADFVQAIGNSQTQGSNRPNIVSYGRDKKFNYTQIFRDPYKISRTARQTGFRTVDMLKDLRTKHLMYHNIGMEEAWFFGERDLDESGVDHRSQTRGIINWVKNDAAQNFADFTTDTDYATWDASASDFIEKNMTQLFLYGNDSNTKMGYCGPKFMELMNRAARKDSSSRIQLNVGQTKFGLNVTEWVAPQGRILWKTHPLFARNEQRQYMAVFVEPSLLKRKIMQDTKLSTLSDDQIKKLGSGFDGYDGVVEEYLTEVGLELHHAKAHGVWKIGETGAG